MYKRGVCGLAATEDGHLILLLRSSMLQNKHIQLSNTQHIPSRMEEHIQDSIWTMSQKKTHPKRPRRLLDYYMQPTQQSGQHGSGQERGDPEQTPEHHNTAADPSSDMEVAADQHYENLTFPGDRGKWLADSPAHSPDKQPPVKHYGAGTCSATADLTAMQSLAAFPTTNNPAWEHYLKAMLLSF